MGWFDKLRQKPKADNHEEVQTRLVPGVGRMPYPAYRGKEPYVFVSYAHLDSAKVFKEIKRFNEAGFHVWYDEGIAPGNEWTDEIADALAGCTLFVVMITPTSAPRENVLNEINFALDEKKPFLAIHLEDTVLERGLKLRTGTKQAILKYNMTEEEYTYKYLEAFERSGLKKYKTVRNIPAVQEIPCETKVQVPSEVPTVLSQSSEFSPAPVNADGCNDSSVDKVRDKFEMLTFNTLKAYRGNNTSVTIPWNVKRIFSSAFHHNDAITRVILPEQVEYIDSAAFDDCSHLEQIIIEGRNVEFGSGFPVFTCPLATIYCYRDSLTYDDLTDFSNSNIPIRFIGEDLDLASIKAKEPKVQTRMIWQ